MKKLISVALVMLIIFSLAGCGERQKNDSDNIETPTSDSVTDSNKEESTDNKNSEIQLSNSYKVPGKNIVVNVPNYQEMEKGFTELFILHGERYVAVTANKNTSVNSLSEAHQSAFEKFKENIQNYSYVNSINISKESNETVNGVEVYKYEGTLNCSLDYSNRDNSYEAYVIGYSFVMDGIPCTITGSVINQTQDEKQITEIKDTVEAMIKTLRSEL